MDCMGKHDLIPEERLNMPEWTICGIPLWHCDVCKSFVPSKTSEDAMDLSRSVGITTWFREIYTAELLHDNLDRIIKKSALSKRKPLMVQHV